jgi:hypothetical protein
MTVNVAPATRDHTGDDRIEVFRRSPGKILTH